MVDRRETLKIAFDPAWSPRQLPPQKQLRRSGTQNSPNPLPNPFSLGYKDNMSTQSAGYHQKSDTAVSQQAVGPAVEAPDQRAATYRCQPDWIAAAERDITDREYDDQDAEEEESEDAGAYTHQAVQARSAAPVLVRLSHRRPAATPAHSGGEFERPRQVPSFNPRNTRAIVKGDLAFFMCLLKGLEPPPPPPASGPEAEAVVLDEEDERRHREEAAAVEAERRRVEELETNRRDLDFFAALIQGQPFAAAEGGRLLCSSNDGNVLNGSRSSPGSAGWP